MNPEIKKKLSIDQASLTKYLFYGYIPSPNTIFEQIKKMEPSSTFQFDVKKWEIINKYRFWRLEDIRLNNNISEKEILEKTEKLLKDAVSKRLMSDVPLGVFLSGGVDSSIIAYYLSQNSSNVNSFTVCYKDSPSADESFYAEKVAKSLGINYHLCQFEDSLVESNFLEIIDYLDEPMADAAIIPLHFIAKFAKKNITVALSGDGGDEVFGGYTKYKAQKFAEDYKYFGFLAGLLGSIIPKGNNYSRFLKVFGLDFPIRQFIWGSGGFLPNEIKNLLI
jgi:asparagine synthase (glutamine-hydrolysing)